MLQNAVSGNTPANLTTNAASSAIIAAPGAARYAHLTLVAVTNEHATQGTAVQILCDGVVKVELFADAKGGFVLPYSNEHPLRGSKNGAWTAKCVTTGASVAVHLSGYTTQVG